MLDMRVIFVDIPPGMVPVGLEEKEAFDADARAVCDLVSGAGWSPVVRLGQPLLDDYVEFLSGRCRPNTVLAVAFDLKVFFTVVGKHPRRVQSADVLAFMTAQRTGAPISGRQVRVVDAASMGPDP
jgi:hypothetical protein